MTFPAVTGGYAALLALIFLGLTAWVSAARMRLRVLHGDGGHAVLQQRIRAHANFAEYVPLILLLTALLEAGGAARATLHALLLPMLIARILHPIGMVAPSTSRLQTACRGAGALFTWVILGVTAVLLLARVL